MAKSILPFNTHLDDFIPLQTSTAQSKSQLSKLELTVSLVTILLQVPTL